MNQIKRVEIHEFTHSAINLGLLTNANTIGAVGYSKGQSIKLDKFAVVIETRMDVEVSTSLTGEAIKQLAHKLKCWHPNY